VSSVSSVPSNPVTPLTFVGVVVVALLLSYGASWVMWRASHANGLVNLAVGVLMSLAVLAGGILIGYLIATLSR
jgi:hypothetical protein